MHFFPTQWHGNMEAGAKMLSLFPALNMVTLLCPTLALLPRVVRCVSGLCVIVAIQHSGFFSPLSSQRNTVLHTLTRARPPAYKQRLRDTHAPSQMLHLSPKVIVIHTMLFALGS